MTDIDQDSARTLPPTSQASRYLENCRVHPASELIERLRNVTLKSHGTIRPVYIYRDAEIRLIDTSPGTLAPAQYYRVRNTLNRVAALRTALAQHGIDMFHLNGYITYQTSDGTSHTMLPPIIEWGRDAQGGYRPIIVDGLHRVSYARSHRIPAIQVVGIRGVSEDFPYYGFPNVRGWRDVRTVSTVPDSTLKRLWRTPLPDAYRLYRDFNTAFEGVGSPRAKGT